MRKSKECKKLCKWYNACIWDTSFGVSKCEYFDPYINSEDKIKTRKEYKKFINRNK